MKYENIRKGIFLSRPNRFIANIEIDGREEVCHVKNTGRCKELLIPGTEVFVQKFDKSDRKTKFDLISVYKGNMLVNIDSQAPNKVVREWLGEYFGKLDTVKPEVNYKNSRFDFYVETGKRKIFIEVKGVTLEENGVAMFPDAPTERGVKHIKELCDCVKNGYEAYIIFVVQMEKAKYFIPNCKTHPEFADVLKNAAANGVKIICVTCSVKEDELKVKDFIKEIL